MLTHYVSCLKRFFTSDILSRGKVGPLVKKNHNSEVMERGRGWGVGSMVSGDRTLYVRTWTDECMEM